MPETGIENMIRGNSSNGGCGSALLVAFVWFLVIFAIIGLGAWYCGPAMQERPVVEGQ